MYSFNIDDTPSAAPSKLITWEVSSTQMNMFYEMKTVGLLIVSHLLTYFVDWG